MRLAGNRSSRRGALVYAVALAVVVAGCADDGGAPGATTAAGRADGPPVRDGLSRGANVTAYASGALAEPPAEAALRALRDAGADQVVFPALWFQDTARSTAIGPEPLQTPSDASIVAAARTAKELGMDVGIAAHINVRDGTFRGRIDPISRADWFASYRRMLVHFADLARRANADLLLVGSELETMSPDTAAWRELIAEARTRFDGRLTYGANWVHEAERIGFWDALDAVGIDAYMPLTPDERDPTVTQLRAAWTPWVQRMERLHRRTGKPVLLTEIGYTSRGGTAQAPAQEGDGPIDQAAQATAYEAAFQALGHRAWIGGILIWDWSADGRESPGDYSPQGKQAQEVLRRWYGGGD